VGRDGDVSETAGRAGRPAHDSGLSTPRVESADIIRIGHGAGARVLVGTVACNLVDCPPFARGIGPDLNEGNGGMGRLFQAGVTADRPELCGGWRVTCTPEIDEAHAELLFRIGQCEGRAATCSARKVSVRPAIWTCSASGGYPINDYQYVAVRISPPRPRWATDFEEHSTNGLIGELFFYEHVHPNFSEIICSLARLFIRSWARPQTRQSF
jgi:hypothetical protein